MCSAPAPATRPARNAAGLLTLPHRPAGASLVVHPARAKAALLRSCILLARLSACLAAQGDLIRFHNVPATTTCPHLLMVTSRAGRQHTLTRHKASVLNQDVAVVARFVGTDSSPTAFHPDFTTAIHPPHYCSFECPYDQVILKCCNELTGTAVSLTPGVTVRFQQSSGREL